MVFLPPREIVVVVDPERVGGAQNPQHAVGHPIASSVGVEPRDLHGGEVVLPGRRIQRNRLRRGVHVVADPLAPRLASGKSQESGRGLMAEPA
jgi:hypothetical protein